MYAHYFITGKTKIVIISLTDRPVGNKIIVSGKNEARKIAKQNNAKCWNF